MEGEGTSKDMLNRRAGRFKVTNALTNTVSLPFATTSVPVIISTRTATTTNTPIVPNSTPVYIPSRPHIPIPVPCENSTSDAMKGDNDAGILDSCTEISPTVVKINNSTDGHVFAVPDPVNKDKHNTQPTPHSINTTKGSNPMPLNSATDLPADSTATIPEHDFKDTSTNTDGPNPLLADKMFGAKPMVREGHEGPLPKLLLVTQLTERLSSLNNANDDEDKESIDSDAYVNDFEKFSESDSEATPTVLKLINSMSAPVLAASFTEQHGYDHTPLESGSNSPLSVLYPNTDQPITNVHRLNIQLAKGDTVLTHGRFSLLSSNTSPPNLETHSYTNANSHANGKTFDTNISTVDQIALQGSIRPISNANINSSINTNTDTHTTDNNSNYDNKIIDCTTPPALSARSNQSSATNSVANIVSPGSPSVAAETYEAARKQILQQSDLDPTAAPFPKSSAGRFHIYPSEKGAGYADEHDLNSIHGQFRPPSKKVNLLVQTDYQDSQLNNIQGATRPHEKRNGFQLYKRGRFQVKDYYIKSKNTTSTRARSSSPMIMAKGYSNGLYQENANPSPIEHRHQISVPRAQSESVLSSDAHIVADEHEFINRQATDPANALVTGERNTEVNGNLNDSYSDIEQAEEVAIVDAPRHRRKSSPRKVQAMKNRQSMFGEPANALMLKEIALVEKQNSNIKKMMTTLHEVYQPPDMSDLFTSLLSDSIAVRMKIIKLGHDNENLRKENTLLKGLLNGAKNGDFSTSNSHPNTNSKKSMLTSAPSDGSSPLLKSSATPLGGGGAGAGGGGAGSGESSTTPSRGSVVRNATTPSAPARFFPEIPKAAGPPQR
eukprot:CFRG4192T1